MAWAKCTKPAIPDWVASLRSSCRPTGIGDDPQWRARFQREARVIAALNNPHICAIHDVATFEGRDVIVMEYLDGETLEQRLHRGRLPLPEFFAHATAIAEALIAAHGEGIIHRDLKPSNVMLTRGGLKLLDFGIAKQREIHERGSPAARPGRDAQHRRRSRAR